MNLEKIGRFPRKRVLTWDEDALYASEGYKILKYQQNHIGHGEWSKVAEFRPDWFRRIEISNKYSSRLMRNGFHVLKIMQSGRLVGVIDGKIVLAESSDMEFRPVFDIPRGTRPLTMTIGVNDTLYWGEYFSNKDREEIHIYASHDFGEHWDVCYTFPKGSTKHIHSVTWDPFQNCFWVLKGDNDSESAVIQFDPHWVNSESIVFGSQQARAATCIPHEEGLYFATDTPLAQNFVYILDKAGNVEKLQSLRGSSLQSCQVNDRIFFSTAVEPSTINNSRICTLVGTDDRINWMELVKWRKDWLPMQLFQFGNILLPTGNNNSNMIAATGMAVKNEDMVTHIWRVE